MTGLKLNLKKPVLYNEKIQWLKIYDRNPDYTNLVDKYEVRKYIAQTIGEEYLVPLYGVWDKFEDITFNALPSEFVLKCTHDSGSILFCKDKQSFDIKKARKILEKRLARNYYWVSREWNYKNIKPRIIAEKLLTNELMEGINDYKIFCFNGEPKIIEVNIDSYKDHKRNFYSTQWEYQKIINIKPNAPLNKIQKPVTLDLMLELANKLSASFIFVRVDFYSINDKVYFGEMTFNDGGGFSIYEPPEWNKTFGDWIILPETKKL